MKKSAIVAGLGALIVLGAPLAFGALARQRVATAVERLDASGRMDAAVVDYSRGWATSTTTIELNLAPGAAQPGAMPDDVPPAVADMVELMAEPFRLEVTVHHGPVMMSDGISLGIAASTIRLDPATPGYAELLADLGIPYLFDIRTVTGFSGRSDFVSEMPGFEYAADDRTVAFSGSRTVGTYDLGSRGISVQGEAASLRVDAPDFSLVLEQLSFRSESVYYNQLLRVGDIEAAVAHIGATGPAGGVEFDGLSLNGDLSIDAGGEHATWVAAYRIASVSDGDEIDLTDLELVATGSQIDIDALSAYILAVQDSSVQGDSAAPFSLAVEDALYDLLAASPVVDLTPVRFSWAGEPLEASVRIAVDGASLPERTNFTALALAFNGVASLDASLELSEALANEFATRGMEYQVRRGAAQEGVFMPEDQVAAIAAVQAGVVLAQLEAQGMVDTTDAGYATTLRFENGELTVNGNTIPLGLR